MFKGIAAKWMLVCALVLAMCGSACTAFAAAKGKTEKAKGETKLESIEKVQKRLKAGTYAVLDTSMGRIICELYPSIAPIGVENFIGLAEGKREWIDPKTGTKVKKPLYNGTIFHRIIPDFMVQGGDPMGSGFGGPGYKFKNEVSSKVTFDRPGRLAYANSGPDTNGSQFFITHKDTSWLNGGYTIFGQCIEGQSVVNAMGAVARGSGDKPIKDVVLEKVTIVRVAGKKK